MKNKFKILIYQPNINSEECKKIGELVIQSENIWKLTEDILKLLVASNNDKNLYADVYDEDDDIYINAAHWLYRIFYKE